jgi:hypothetical protein
VFHFDSMEDDGTTDRLAAQSIASGVLSRELEEDLFLGTRIIWDLSLQNLRSATIKIFASLVR